MPTRCTGRILVSHGRKTWLDDSLTDGWDLGLRKEDRCNARRELYHGIFGDGSRVAALFILILRVHP